MKVIAFLYAAIFITTIPCAAAIARDQFSDDFERRDSDSVGNDWMEDEDAGISVTLKDGEVLIHGTQDVNWDRDGIRRGVDDIESLFFDYLANDEFSIHVRIDDAITNAYIDVYAPPGGSFSYASSLDGDWPGWTEAGGNSPLVGYTTLGIIKKDDFHFQLIHRGQTVADIANENLSRIGEIFISVDSAAGTSGSAHIDNVVIDGDMPDVEEQPGKGAIADDFDRPDSDNIGRGWTTQFDSGLSVAIRSNEVLIQGTQTIDWMRTGISRQLENVETIFFDYLANDHFNIHVRIDDAVEPAYIEFYASPGAGFSYASSEDGTWPDWTPAGGHNPNTGEYATLGVVQVQAGKGKYELLLNDEEIYEVKNSKLTNIGSVLISVDAAAGTTGSAHIDNVMINGEEAQRTVTSRGKLTTTWGGVKKSPENRH
jgi:hypothetical protein